MTKTAVFKSDLFLAHMENFPHIESADRLKVIYQALKNEGIGNRLLYPEFEAVTNDILEYNHHSAYVAKVAATDGKTYVSLDPDTQTSALSFQAASLAVGAAVSGVKMIHQGEINNGFCLVRPPGHHAESDQAMGFCLFNNAALAARYAIKELGYERVLLVDWDLHHGNGTQHSFYDTDKVLYFSTHQHPFFPGTGAATETGIGAGLGYTINVPLPAGIEDRAYATVFNDLLAPIARQYKPQFIILSAGYDTHRNDPLGGMAVTGKGFAYMTKVLLDLATELCDGRFLACLEGGYDLNGLREGIIATLSEMAGHSQLTDKAVLDLSTTAVPVMAMEVTKEIVKEFWDL